MYPFTLRSSAISLMLIHFLQCGCSPPVLPNLLKMMPNVFHDRSNIESLKEDQTLPDFKSANKQSLGKLLVGFFRYYSQEFNFDQHIIDMKGAKRVNKDGVRDFILIRDPFTDQNVAKSVQNFTARLKIEDAFRKSYSELAKNKNLDLLFSRA